MNYKEKQQDFKSRLHNQIKMIWVSKEIANVPHPSNAKEFIKVSRMVYGNYIKSKHGLIGSKSI